MKRIFFVALVCTTFIATAQERSVDVTNVTRVSFLTPGFSYEARIGPSQTLLFRAFLNASGSFMYSSSQGTDASLHLDPALGIQYRYYYNGYRRLQKGKSTAWNSMNYFSASFKSYLSSRPIADSYFDIEDTRLIHVASVLWGLQRNYRRRFSLDFNVGPGVLITRATVAHPTQVAVSETRAEFVITGTASLGMWLNKRR